MKNFFMENFKKRLTKALLVGGAIALIMVLSPLFMEPHLFSSIPWFLVPVVLVVAVLYGTGWYFAFNLIKRVFRKFLRVNRDASIWQAITGRGLILGFFYSMICLTLGCFISFIVGNYFMIRDFMLAKQDRPPVSLKYKFDNDLEYDNWLSTLRAAVTYSDIANNVDPITRLSNEAALDNIENGDPGVIITERKEGGKTITTETTIL
ncbi:MAG: hypothetical protein IJ304_03170 [Clostridia bacterium]|nr:hypothetical protein [Clostridia bacterium]